MIRLADRRGLLTQPDPNPIRQEALFLTMGWEQADRVREERMAWARAMASYNPEVAVPLAPEVFGTTDDAEPDFTDAPEATVEDLESDEPQAWRFESKVSPDDVDAVLARMAEEPLILGGDDFDEVDEGVWD